MTLPHEHNQKLMRNIIPSMRYNGQEPFTQWQERAGKKLQELLGLPFPKCDDRFTVEYVLKQEGFTETRFLFQSEEGYFVPCHLLVPEGASKPLPVVVCLQGHSKGMHISLGRPKYPGDKESILSGDRDFCVRAVKEGFCALAIEQRCFGECGGTENGPDCFNSSMSAILIGRTTSGERVHDVHCALDVLEKYFPQVDTQKIISLGHSGGGTTAFFLGCLDPRVRVNVISGYVCTFEDSIAAMEHCSCNFVPGIRNYFEVGDLSGLIAPRPLVVVSGKDDDIFPQHGVQKTYALIQSQYLTAGAAQNCALVVGSGGHRFYADQAWPVIHSYIDSQ